MVKLGPLEFKVYTQDDPEYTARRSAPVAPGRCADRVEDFLSVVLRGWNSSAAELEAVWTNMIECLRSDEGDEPRARYVLLTKDSPAWRDHAARPSRVARMREQEGQATQQQAQQATQQAQQQPSIPQPRAVSAGQETQQQRQQTQQPQPQHEQQPPWYSLLWRWRQRQAPHHPMAAAAADAKG